MTGVIQPYRGIWPEIAEDAYVADTAVVVGDVAIGAESSLWFGVIARGDVNDIRIGERTNIQDGTVIHVSSTRQGTYIGNDATIGHMALIHACTLEDGCFIGMRASVMDGCVVESGAMVAAGALVTPGRRVKSGEVWSGVPATVMRDLRPEEVAHMSDVAERYRALGAEYRRASATIASIPSGPTD